MAETLRARLTQKPIVVAPGVYDAFTALVATQASFETLYVSGAAIAYRSAAASAGRSGGSVTWKVVPWPGTLSTTIAPPCSWRMP